VTTAFWTPKSPRRAMVAVTVAVAAICPVFTSLGSVGDPGRAPYAPVVLGAVLAALQVRTSYAASRGERPRWPWPTLLVMAALVYAPMYWYTWNWAATQYMLGASVLMLVPRRRLAVALAAAPVIGTVAKWDWPGGPVGVIAFGTAWWGIGMICGITALYGAARLVRVVDELQRARTELAELAIARERLRVSRDVLTVTRAGAAIDLRAEAEGARALLAAAGIDPVVRLEDAGMPPAVETVFAWALREGVTNVLRHSEATTCVITGSRDRLEIVNDGVRSPVPGAGSGLAGLAERARAFSGQLTAGPSGDGEFRLLVEFP
jgi:two-component system sensor histidine kinase DesK